MTDAFHRHRARATTAAAAGTVPLNLVAALPPVTVVVVALVAGIVSLLLYDVGVPVTRRTVVALVPWMVVGSALSVFAGLVEYPSLVASLFEPAAVHLTVYVVAATAMFAMVQLSIDGLAGGNLDEYLGTMGIGAATVAVAFVVLRGGVPGISGILWLVFVPIIAVAAAFVVVITLGIWYSDAAAYTGIVGALVVFGQTLDGLSTVVRAGLFDAGDHTWLSWRVLDAAAALVEAGAVGLDRLLVWSWGLLWIKTLVGIGAVVLLTSYARKHPTRANVALGLIAAVGITAGATDLLLVAVGR